jgi:GNAT superfamily N-acetyltransferase
MLLRPALESEYAAVVELVNRAYRGSGDDTVASWNIETGIVGGQRLDESLLREELATKPGALMLTCRDEADGPLLGSVWLQPKQDGVWYLGLLTVRPDLQNRQMGRTLLAAAEDYARQHGASRIRLTVLNVRDTLIAWYGRRGYFATGETEPFPYGDERFGKPLRDDLHFVAFEKDI